MSKASCFATTLATAASYFAVSCAGPAATPGGAVVAAATAPSAVVPGSIGFYVFVLAVMGVLLFSSLMLIKKPAT